MGVVGCWRGLCSTRILRIKSDVALLLLIQMNATNRGPVDHNCLIWAHCAEGLAPMQWQHWA